MYLKLALTAAISWVVLGSHVAADSDAVEGVSTGTQSIRERLQQRRAERKARRGGRSAEGEVRIDRATAAALENPRLAASNWPIYHGNRNSTGASPRIGPGAVSQAETVDGLTSRRIRPAAVSPWTLAGERYRDGSQPIFTSPMDGVGKYLIQDGRLEQVDFLKLQRGLIDFDWALLVLAGNLAVVTEQKRDRFTIVGDARPGDPRSPLEVKKRIPVDRETYGQLTAHHSLAPSGHLIALTDDSKLLAVDLAAGRVAAAFDLSQVGGYNYHNSFPIDDGGRIYLAAQQEVIAVDWDGRSFDLAWKAAYDMRGPGCEDTPEDRPFREEAMAVSRGEPCTGSGTTPTLLGGREDVLVLVDGHSPANNLLAFWRDRPPAGWQPLDDPTGRTDKLDPRVAGVIALPHSTPDGDGFTAENSPAALDFGVFIAQWAGLDPKARSPRGVQRVDWNPATRSFALKWANPNVQVNGVPLVACASERRDCHAYGMGRYGREYVYTSIDWETGRITGRVPLGSDDAVLDQGNGNAVADDGSILYHGRHKIVRVR